MSAAHYFRSPRHTRPVIALHCGNGFIIHSCITWMDISVSPGEKDYAILPQQPKVIEVEIIILYSQPYKYYFVFDPITHLKAGGEKPLSDYKAD